MRCAIRACCAEDPRMQFAHRSLLVITREEIVHATDSLAGALKA